MGTAFAWGSGLAGLLAQARRISDYLGFFLEGRLVEFGEAGEMLANPRQKATEDYLTGRFG
ncbi:MAG: hypothetical protein ACPLPT_09140 [Moorellales bacterium]